MLSVFLEKKINIVFILACLICWPGILQGQDHNALTDRGTTRVAVIPFSAITPPDDSSTVQCPLCGSVNSSGPIAERAPRIIQDIVTDKLIGMSQVAVVDSDKTAAVYKRISVGQFKQSLGWMLQKVGKELQADVVAVGFVYRYRERVGYRYSAERPASVAFEIHLVSVADGSSLWRGIFDQTQKSLMEDVFRASSFFRGGAKWVTARELSQLGVDEVFKTFPGFER